MLLAVQTHALSSTVRGAPWFSEAPAKPRWRFKKLDIFLGAKTTGKDQGDRLRQIGS
jgi:hypothetical protein